MKLRAFLLAALIGPVQAFGMVCARTEFSPRQFMTGPRFLTPIARMFLWSYFPLHGTFDFQGPTGTSATYQRNDATMTYQPTAGGSYSTLGTNGVPWEAQGLAVYPATNNLVLQSETFGAAAWVALNMSVSVNAGDVTDPFGGTASDTLTASAANATLTQAVVLASGSRRFFCWIRRRTGTGEVDMTEDTVTYTAMTLTSSFKRFYVEQSGLANPTVGFRIVTSGDAIDVFGAQLSDISSGGRNSVYTKTVAATNGTAAVTAVFNSVAGAYSTATVGSMFGIFTPRDMSVTSTTPFTVNACGASSVDTSNRNGLSLFVNTQNSSTEGSMFSFSSASTNNEQGYFGPGPLADVPTAILGVYNQRAGQNTQTCLVRQNSWSGFRTNAGGTQNIAPTTSAKISVGYRGDNNLYWGGDVRDIFFAGHAFRPEEAAWIFASVK